MRARNVLFVSMIFSSLLIAGEEMAKINKAMRITYREIKDEIKKPGLESIGPLMEKMVKFSKELSEAKVDEKQEEFNEQAKKFFETVQELNEFVLKNDESSFKKNFGRLRDSCIKCHKNFMGAFKRFLVNLSF